MAGPWREVARIEHREGPRGGRYWSLTLECGHWAMHPKPSQRPSRVYSRVALSVWKGNLSGGGLAPKKKRCLFCR